jgi:hypothetical protein
MSSGFPLLRNDTRTIVVLGLVENDGVRDLDATKISVGCFPDLDNHVAMPVSATFLVTTPISSTSLPSITTMFSNNSFYQEHTIVSSLPKENLRSTIDVLSANVQAKGNALAAPHNQLITRLPFVFLSQGVHIFQCTKGINVLLAQDFLKNIVTPTAQRGAWNLHFPHLYWLPDKALP